MFTNAIRKFYIPLFALTTFLSAFLLFQVQPLIAKLILPWFGGNQAVWTTSLIFFQIFLVAGYAYAFLSSKYLKFSTQVTLHSAFLLASLLFLPILPSASFKNVTAADPTLRIIFLLSATVGAPYFLLASSTPLLQKWLHVSGTENPYRFYALSNFASLTALLSYPFAIEPLFSGSIQAKTWSILFFFFAVFSVISAFSFFSRVKNISAENSPDTETAHGAVSSGGGSDGKLFAFGKLRNASWLIYSAVGTLLLVATTSKITQNIAAVPLLWVIPLAVYLLTMILSFAGPAFYKRKIYVFQFLFFAVIVGAASVAGVSSLPLPIIIILYSTILFFACMILHGELANAKPDPKFLGSYYLAISAGGAFGGIFAGIIAPRIFKTVLELELGIFMATLVVAKMLFEKFFEKSSDSAGPVYAAPTVYGSRPVFRKSFLSLMAGLLLIAVWAMLYYNASHTYSNSRYTSRNFYGFLNITETGGLNNSTRLLKLISGNIIHGAQYEENDGVKRKTAPTYYGPQSGVGILFDVMATRGKPIRIGVAGLGTGTLAAYAKQGDYIKFYEINPEVVNIARKYFTYLADTPATSDIALGDARLSMEKEDPQQFDIIVLDAFSSDAVPVHLLTREAMAVYLKHLKPDGALAFNISNIYLDLKPVVAGQAEFYGMKYAAILSKLDREIYALGSEWMLLSRNEALLNSENIRNTAEQNINTRKIRLWTDDYSNLFSILKSFSGK